MRIAWVVALCAAQEVGDEPTVPQPIHDLEVGVNAAKVAAHTALGAAALSRSEQNAAQAQGVQAQAQLSAAKVHAEVPPLETATEDATEAGAEAAASAAKANEALESVTGMAEPVVEEAALLAKKEVHIQLAKMYKDLDSWRHKVLVNPYEEAKKAGAAAAKPYYDGMKAYQARIGEYTLQANLAAGQASSLADQAMAKSSGAQGKMASGNTVGANQDLVEARRMMDESGSFKATAGSLQGMIGQMNKQVPEYIAAAHLAAWRKEYEVNPNDFPPPPASVNAFTPAPVATDFLQANVVKPLPALLQA